MTIKAAIEDGLPTYAECGGLMYLARKLTWQDKACEMVGVIPGDISMHARPRGRGYIQLQEGPAHPWPGGPDDASFLIPGHEFHYSVLENLPAKQEFAYHASSTLDQSISLPSGHHLQSSRHPEPPRWSPSDRAGSDRRHEP